MQELLLAGDIGGTNTRLRVVGVEDVSASIAEEQYGRRRPVAEAIAAFLEEHKLSGRLVAAGFGAAGRVVDGRVQMTNRPGESISDAALSGTLGLPPARVRIVNDMEAHLAGVDAADVVDLRPGAGRGLVEGIVMPGTGLGIGWAIRIDGRRLPFPSEGGHLDFAPPVLELDFLREAGHALLDNPLEGRLSWEHLVSGPGLARLYAAILSPNDPTAIPRPDPEQITASACAPTTPTGADDNTGGEGNARHAIDHDAAHDPAEVDRDAAVEAVRLFLTLTGARAGNLCLDILATAGIHFGGGILNRLHDHDAERTATLIAAAFDACGPDALRDTLHNTPLRLIRSPDSGLLGAATLARELI